MCVCVFEEFRSFLQAPGDRATGREGVLQGAGRMEKHLSQTQCIGLNSDLTSKKKKTTSCLSFPDCKMTRTEYLFPPPPISSVEGVNGKAGCGSVTALGGWAVPG